MAQRSKGWPEAFHGRSATHSRVPAAIPRAASQKEIAFSGSAGVMKSGMPWNDSMWLKSRIATPAKPQARLSRVSARSRR